MAFVSRAERNLEVTSKHLSNLGPGAYISHTEYVHNPSYAPFSAATERQFNRDFSKTSIPGPGTYSIPESSNSISKHQVSIDQWGNYKKTGTFASNQGRFTEKFKPSTPGPGTYQISDPWNPKNKETIKPDPTNINWIRIPSAPSIPSQNEIYGYDETPTGELIMEYNPEKVYSGGPSDSVGPGHYNPQKPSEKNKGTSWHKSTAPRVAYEKLSTNTAIGPGSYTESKVNIAPLYKFRPTVAFSSATKRTSFIPPTGKNPELEEDESNDEQGIPGPGYYFSSESHSSFKPKKVPTHIESFGSNSMRFRSESAEGKLGPGYYGDMRENIAERKTGDSRAPFASTKIRFEKQNAPLPGPGAYKEGEFVEYMHKKVWGKQGVFGTTEKRFTQNKNLENPGPGHYPPDAHKRVGMHNSANRKGMSVFTSKAGREVNYNNVNPAPGSYEVQNFIGAKKINLSTQPLLMHLGESNKRSVGFESEADRFVGTRSHHEIGPGSYEPKMNSKTESHSSIAKVFSSRAERFPGKYEEEPGPGAYHDLQNEEYWNKRSYNIHFSELV